MHVPARAKTEGPSGVVVQYFRQPLGGLGQPFGALQVDIGETQHFGMQLLGSTNIVSVGIA